MGGGGEKKTEKEKKTGLDYSKWDNLDVDDTGEVLPAECIMSRFRAKREQRKRF